MCEPGQASNGAPLKPSCALLQVAVLLAALVLLAGCGDGETEPGPGEGGGGAGGGTVECSIEDPFDPAQCPTAYPDYECVAYVDGEVEASGDGWSWASAAKTVQEGIDLARCGALHAGVCEQWQVWVKQGSYFVNQGCREHAVRLRPNVSVYGGFSGTETSVFARDWESNETILDGRDGLTDPENASRVHHVVAGSDDAVFDGFTIQYGLADHDFDELHQAGAGMGNLSASPTVENCTFRRNQATFVGAAMVNYDGSSPTIANCTFVDNESGGSGGAIYNDLESSPAFADCLFQNNRSGGHGGAIAAGDGALTVSNSTFDGNRAYWQGGAINTESGTAAVTDCTFENNVSQNGGALRFSSTDAAVTGCAFTNNWSERGDTGGGSGGAIKFSGSTTGTASECTFTNNSADHSGGAITVSDGASASVSSCTFQSNSAFDAGGAINVWEASLVVVESSEFLQNETSQYSGGAIVVGESSADIIGCTFDGNKATNNGGGVHAWSNTTLTVTACVFSANDAEGGGGLSVLSSTADVTDCSFRDNAAQFSGGGLMTGNAATMNVVSGVFHGNLASEGGAIEAGTAGPLSLLNCTIAGNEATTAGGGIANAAELTVTNSILWGNTSGEIVQSGTTAISVTYSDIDDATYSDPTNIHVLPSFANAPTGDLHLQSDSPCIDVANDAVAPATDLDGSPRVGLPDMGAYEYQP